MDYRDENFWFKEAQKKLVTRKQMLLQSVALGMSGGTSLRDELLRLKWTYMSFSED